SLPWSVVGSAACGDSQEAVAEEPGSPFDTRVCASCVSCLPARLALSVATCARRICYEDGVAIAASACEALSDYRNAGLNTSGMCRRIVDGRAHPAVDWAGGRQPTARWSTMNSRRSNREKVPAEAEAGRPRQHGKDGATDTGTTCNAHGVRMPVEEWAGVASRLCAKPRLRGDDGQVDTRNRFLATPKIACHAVCAPSFSSRSSFQFRRLT
ncbi:hypothetical protein MOQ_009900, partial [Trypanosoma cruzi marinkellei]